MAGDWGPRSWNQSRSSFSLLRMRLLWTVPADRFAWFKDRLGMVTLKI
jgi:hypothetical protein